MEKKKQETNSDDFANAIVDIDLTVLRSNSTFREFFKNQKNWSKSKLKITQLIEFDNLPRFKKSLLESKEGEVEEGTFRGKIKISKTEQPILVKIGNVQKGSKKWKNQVINLTCQIPEISSADINLQVFDSLPFEVLIVDHTIHLIYFNEKAKGEFKKTSKTEIKLGDKLELKWGNKENYKEKFEAILNGEVSFTESIQTFENQKYLLALSPLKNKNGDILGCLVLIKNISQLHVLDISKQKEVEIQKKEILELKSRAKLNKKYQLELQEELDLKLRELHSNLMLIFQKNQLLQTLEQRVKKIMLKSDKVISQELRKIIKIIKSQINIDDSWEKFKIHFVKMDPEFFKNLKKQSNELSENELRHCAYIRIGLSVKETAQLLSVLPSTIEMARYRIKKKMKLGKSQKLSDFVKGL